MKVSIYMTTYNKNKYLPNTLSSIMRQRGDFDFNVCIVDDHSDIDPEPIIRRFCPEANYMRLDRNVGFIHSKSYGLQVIPEDTDVVILQSDHVVQMYRNTVELLCKAVGPRRPAFATVKNMTLAHDAYKDFRNSGLYNKARFERKMGRSGPNVPHRWYFFLGAILMEDLLAVRYGEPHCDLLLKKRMERKGFKPVFPDARGVHQNHSVVWYPCPFESTCKYVCKPKRLRSSRVRARINRRKGFNERKR